jgi:hypothetical protein
MNNATLPVKHIFDASFRYAPSFDTDIRKTFERIRNQQAQAREQADPPSRVKVLRLDHLNKASSSLS